MKRAIIIHAWDESPQTCWYQWLKHELEASGLEVTVPAMPEPGAPKIGSWVAALQEVLPVPDHDTVLIGHSIGCQAILRYLAELPDNQEIGQAIFVAPWTRLVNLGEASQQIAAPWLETPIDWSAATAHCSKFTALFSDDDKWVPAPEEQIFHDKLNAQTRMFHRMGHFDVITELPQVLELLP